jgi:signal transduction histidine kinase
MIASSLLRLRTTRALPTPSTRLEAEWESMHRLMRDDSKSLNETLSRPAAKRLDADDIRVLVNLAAFASFAIAKDEVDSVRLDEERVDAAAKVAHELAHAVNNPLQALTNTLYLMDDTPGEHLQAAQFQLQRINTLVRMILDENARPFKH